MYAASIAANTLVGAIAAHLTAKIGRHHRAVAARLSSATVLMCRRRTDALRVVVFRLVQSTSAHPSVIARPVCVVNAATNDVFMRSTSVTKSAV